MFRRFIPAVATALFLAACSSAPTETVATEPTLDAVLESSDQGASAVGFLDRAAAGLQLTDAQKAAIRTINEQFRQTNKADLDALTAIVREAMTAHRNGASQADMIAILERGRPIRVRLAPAFAALRVSLNAVLTDAQRAWLAANAHRLGPDLPPLPGR